MTNPDGLSSRMTNIIAAVLPQIAVTVAERSSSGPPKIDLATAENWLVRRELVSIYKEAFATEANVETLSYPQGFGGDPKLLTALAAFFNAYFRPAIRVEESHIAVTAGATSCLDQLLYNICDPGDSVLVPTPYWNGFDFHLTLRTAVNILPVSCASLSSSVSSTLLSALDGAYDAAPERSRIKAVVITNPHNPFGQCYPREAIKGLLRWCGQRDLHFIGDEVYGLSEFRRPRNEEGFVSALSVISETAEQRTELNGGSGRSLAKTSGSTSRPFSGDRDAKPTMNGHSLAREEPSGLTSSDMDNSDGGTEESTIDVSRVHIIWSLSKDLGCSGLRIATLISQRNNALLTGLRLLSTPLLSSPSTLLATALFSSEKLHAIIKLTRVRLARAYRIVEAQLRRWRVDFIEPRAGVFVWARLLLRPARARGGTDRMADADGPTGPEIDPSSKDDGGEDDWERRQVERLREDGVLIGLGGTYHLSAWPEEKGWVRITFAVEEERLRAGLRKIETVLGLGMPLRRL